MPDPFDDKLFREVLRLGRSGCGDVPSCAVSADEESWGSGVTLLPSRFSLDDLVIGLLRCIGDVVWLGLRVVASGVPVADEEALRGGILGIVGELPSCALWMGGRGETNERERVERRDFPSGAEPGEEEGIGSEDSGEAIVGDGQGG